MDGQRGAVPADRGRVAVVGAGIAGLSAAHELRKQGFTPVVFEATDRVGGRIKSFRRGDFLFDVGAFTYLGSYAESVELIREVGLASQLSRSDAYGAMPRGGELHYLDLSRPVRTLAGSRYLSNRSKVKALKLMGLLARQWKNLNYHDASGIAAIDDDTVASYCRRELNEELLEYLGGVVVRGPWLSDPEQASIGQLLWTMKNFFQPHFYGLRDGMDALPRALAARLDVRLGHPVVNVTDNGRGVDVTYQAETGERSELFEGCVIATTTDRALSMYPQMSGPARELYLATEYIASVNTHLALSRRPAEPAAYIMASRLEQPDLCGVIADHKKADGRAPADKGLLTIFCQHEWCRRNLDAEDDVILQQVLEFIKPYYGDLSNDIEDYAIGRWPQIVPIMPKGRFRQLASFERSMAVPARVQLAGDLDPIGGINSALVSGRSAGKRLAAVRGPAPVPAG